jgi:signal transduction histidine kinase
VARFGVAGVRCTVDNRLPEAEVPLSLSRTAYRIVQEGLANAEKHAPGAPIRLRLHRDQEGRLHVWMSNVLTRVCGRTGPGTRSGLVGLSERVNLVGGRFDHGIRRGAEGDLAFHLEAWMPWPM